MRRKILIVLLSLGTVAGFASGIASCTLRCHARHQRLEQHVAQICVDAARNASPAK